MYRLRAMTAVYVAIHAVDVLVLVCALWHRKSVFCVSIVTVVMLLLWRAMQSLLQLSSINQTVDWNSYFLYNISSFCNAGILSYAVT